MSVPRDEFVRLAMNEIDALDRVARSLTRSAADADDLVQDTYLRALRSHEQFKLHEFGIRPWLLRILHNTHINRQKRERRAPVGMEPEMLEAAPTTSAPTPIPEFSGTFDDDALNAAM